LSSIDVAICLMATILQTRLICAVHSTALAGVGIGMKGFSRLQIRPDEMFLAALLVLPKHADGGIAPAQERHKGPIQVASLQQDGHDAAKDIILVV
jgi:hypothetical protein